MSREPPSVLKHRFRALQASRESKEKTACFTSRQYVGRDFLEGTVRQAQRMAVETIDSASDICVRDDCKENGKLVNGAANFLWRTGRAPGGQTNKRGVWWPVVLRFLCLHICNKVSDAGSCLRPTTLTSNEDRILGAPSSPPPPTIPCQWRAHLTEHNRPLEG